MRAIILAAGIGSRLKPLTNTTPKPLLEINSQSFIERQISFLKQAGINDIIIVVGYLHKKFEFLINKYNVKLIYNDKYSEYNNIYSMYLARKYLSDSYVLESDVYLSDNILDTTIKDSTYFAVEKKSFNNEWVLEFNDNKIITDISIYSGFNKYIMSGISYWNKKDGNYICTLIEEKINSNNFHNLYWDNIVQYNLHNFNIKINMLNPNSVIEIDTVDEFKKFTNSINNKLKL